MRARFVVPVLLVACVVSTAAIAANDKVTATFESLSASGVTGEAVLNAMPGGGTQIHGKIRGLQPNAEYISRVFEQDQSCASGTASVQIVRFVANPAGLGNFNEKVPQSIVGIRSISVELASTSALQACAPVTQ
jgi:hypothetical protein